jgi:UDPglucose 6-dehydrogenase
VADGNTAHKHWTHRKLLELLCAEQPATQRDALAGRHVAIWGLTYKPGTDTLRRSSAIELCRWLAGAGASVHTHDPAVKGLPADLTGKVELCASPLEAATGADVLVVCTPWPDYTRVPVDDVLSALALAQVIDPAGVLRATFAAHPGVRYVRVGSGLEIRVRRGRGATPAERPQATAVSGARTPVSEPQR